MKNKQLWLFIPAVIIAIVTVFPVLWNVSGAFKKAGDTGHMSSFIPKISH